MRRSTVRLLALGIVCVLAAIVSPFMIHVVNPGPLFILFFVGVGIIALALVLGRFRL